MKVSHVLLRVSDMDWSVAFYRDVVGLAVLSQSPAFSFIDAGSIRIGLHAQPELVSEADSTEIVLETESVRSVYADMATRGVPFEIELRPVMSHEGKDLVAAHFRDKDGHLWSITGWIDAG